MFLKLSSFRAAGGLCARKAIQSIRRVGVDLHRSGRDGRSPTLFIVFAEAEVFFSERARVQPSHRFL